MLVAKDGETKSLQRVLIQGQLLRAVGEGVVTELRYWHTVCPRTVLSHRGCCFPRQIPPSALFRQEIRD